MGSNLNSFALEVAFYLSYAYAFFLITHIFKDQNYIVKILLYIPYIFNIYEMYLIVIPIRCNRFIGAV